MINDLILIILGSIVFSSTLYRLILAIRIRNRNSNLIKFEKFTYLFRRRESTMESEYSFALVFHIIILIAFFFLFIPMIGLFSEINFGSALYSYFLFFALPLILSIYSYRMNLFGISEVKTERLLRTAYFKVIWKKRNMVYKIVDILSIIIILGATIFGLYLLLMEERDFETYAMILILGMLVVTLIYYYFFERKKPSS